MPWHLAQHLHSPFLHSQTFPSLHDLQQVHFSVPQQPSFFVSPQQPLFDVFLSHFLQHLHSPSMQTHGLPLLHDAQQVHFSVPQHPSFLVSPQHPLSVDSLHFLQHLHLPSLHEQPFPDLQPSQQVHFSVPQQDSSVVPQQEVFSSGLQQLSLDSLLPLHFLQHLQEPEVQEHPFPDLHPSQHMHLSVPQQLISLFPQQFDFCSADISFQMEKRQLTFIALS